MMTNEQVAAYKEKINKMIDVHKAELHISSEGGEGRQYSANLNGRVKGLELALSLLSDVLDNE